MKLPDFITHYYERDCGPFLNMCDLSDQDIQIIAEREKDALTGFNRFAIGDDFVHWRKAADDLLIRSYTEKFDTTPSGRPFFALLGEFDKTQGLYRNSEKLELAVSEFADHELTFMYPDHAHLIGYYKSDAPSLFYDLPKNWKEQPFWGKLFTYSELVESFEVMGINKMIESHKNNDGWAGCYVEAHIWKRNIRDTWVESGGQ